MFIGRVISGSNNLVLLDFIDVTTDISLIDSSIPTLIVGKKRAEEIYGKERIKVLDKCIENNIYWTYAKNERRADFEKDLQEFNKLVVKNLFDTLKYEFFNIFMEPISRIKAFIQYINSNRQKIIFKNNNHLYIYTVGNKNIIGLSLFDIEYCGIDKDKVINKIKQNHNNIVFEDKDFLSPRMNRLLFDSNILVPYLYFLK